jgi:excinuclease ABC subunit A
MRARVDGVICWLEEDVPLDRKKRHSIEVVIDRLKVKDDNRTRVAEAVETALKLSDGFVLLVSDGKNLELTEKYVCPDCQISLPEIEPRLFSFNNPSGACPECSGLGFHEHFSPELAVAGGLSILEGAFIPWKTM